MIAQAKVTGIESRWVDAPQGRLIKTYVTFAVEKQLKGEPRDTLNLEFLGGTVGSDTMHVSGMPEFRVGEEEIVFVQGNGVQFCPLVRFGHGRYHVHTDAQTHRRFVARNDETPLNSVDDVQLPAADHGAARAFRSSDTALSPDEFENQISTEIGRAAAPR